MNPLRNIFHWSGSLILSAFVFGLISSCSQSTDNSAVEILYDTAIINHEKGFYTQAADDFQKVIDENPGTRYATFAYLKKADALFASGSTKYDEAETNYRLFLAYNPNHHLVPYVLERLINLNFKRNEHWFFGYYHDHDRDPEPYHKIITEYQRFSLLHPESLYLQASRETLDMAVEAIANHEFTIGNWYYEHSLYPSAIARYTYLLREFPGFTKTGEVISKLIETYKINQQPRLAEELERTYRLYFDI